MPTSRINYFEKAETSKDAEQGTHSLIESRDDAYSRHGSTTFPYPSLMNDGCFARCHPVSVPPGELPTYFTESYRRSLLRLGNGLPLWDPIGDVARPQPHVKSSLMIGDVGFLSVHGDFAYCFNIFLPRSDPGQGRLCPEDFEPLLPPLQPSEVVTNPKHFPPGTTLVSPGVDVSCASTEPLDITFTVRAREGGMLILPDGASREDLVSTARVRDYVLKHIRNWYIFKNPGIHTKVLRPNGSLCVITGHDKATSWLAAQAGPYNRTGKARTVSYAEGDWKEPVGVLAQTSEVIADYDIDHCAVFVRTMRFALSTRDWMQHLLHNEPTQTYTFHYIPTVPVFGPRAFVQTMIEGIFKKEQTPASSECTEHTFHPSIVVLRYLLAESPLSDVATIEDSVWNSVASETDGSLFLTTRALIKLLESHQISEQNGYVTLIPPSTISSEEIPPPGSKKFPFSISDALQAHLHKRHERKKIATRLSKLFPGPPLPAYFRRPDPKFCH